MDEMDTRHLRAISLLAKEVDQLSRSRNDLVVGIVVAVLDLYRQSFQNKTGSKEAAVARLQTQSEQLKTDASGLGTISLNWIIAALDTGKLDAAKFHRAPVAGSA